jgi:2-(1,2-epoxy-1,2-dihydrophenyl)acetyl-CoA isomerase
VNLETVDLRRSDGVAWVTMNRPEALNAWTRQLGRDMIAALDEVAAAPELRAIVITGAGRAFSSGADLKAGGEMGGEPEDADAARSGEAGSRAGTRPAGVDVLTPLREVYNPLILRVRTIPKPVIAAVNGPAVGIGCSLALAADLVVASRSAYFLLAFVNIGLGLDGGVSQSLVARVGHARAFEMAYLGQRIGAEQAERWNLINEVLADDALTARAGELATRLAAGPPGSFATIKKTINDRAYAGFRELLDLEAVEQQKRAESRDFVEGVLAFMQKRQPEFRGE